MDAGEVTARPYVLHSVIELPAARRDEAAVRLLAFVEATRAEPGCLAFELHEEAGQPGRFMVYEVFRDDAAFEAHRRAPGLAPLKEWLGEAGAAVRNVRHDMLSAWQLAAAPAAGTR